MQHSIDERHAQSHQQGRKLRILLARYSLDGHDRGLITVMHELRNCGLEIVYVLFDDSKEIAKAAIEEAADMIGLTASMGEHLTIVTQLMQELRNSDLDIPVIVGGVISSADAPELERLGVKKVFGPGSRPADISAFIEETLNKHI